MTTREFIVRITQGEDGSLWADVRDLPGCFASGDDLDELRAALEEAISLYLHDDPDAGHLDDLRPQTEPHPSMTVDEMRVAVAC